MDAQQIKKKIVKALQKEIPVLVDEDNDFSLNQLESKQNMVFELVFEKKPVGFPKEVILKIFHTDNAEKEYNTLKKLYQQEMLVPNIIILKKPYLILERIEGKNLCDIINENLDEKNVLSLDDLEKYLKDRIVFSINKLAGWISQLHRQNILSRGVLSDIIVLNKGDTRLRDFVISSANDECYGLDFEDSYEGNHIDDIAWICCALLDTTPGLFELGVPKHKIELINLFLKAYYRVNKDFNFNFNYFAEKLIEYLNIVIERRGIDLSPLSKNNILKNIIDGYGGSH